ncbi:glycoside hydrolase family 18 protein [Amanita rubescens]|nr:glycoside hydrolase family 18 protein [Amanita rubescens]
MFLTRVFSLGISLLLAIQTLSNPIHLKTRNEHEDEVLVARAAPSAPYFFVHSDLSTGSSPPNPSLLAGYNVFSLAFLVTGGIKDNAQSWAALSATQKSSIKSQYAAAGITLMATAFGDTDTPTTSGVDPVSTANTFAAWVINNQLDGIDIDYEDFQAFNAGNGNAENWLITFTRQLRSHLPQGQYIITHSRKFAPNKWGGGGYLKVNAEVGNLIDWYNVQFYNQGSAEYTTCSGLLTQSSSVHPNSALFQISANGIPLSKLVIGKPATSQLTYSGYMDTSTLASCLEQAKNQGWDGGVMVWEYPEADATWIANVRSQSWPVS